MSTNTAITEIMINGVRVENPNFITLEELMKRKVDPNVCIGLPYIDASQYIFSNPLTFVVRRTVHHYYTTKSGITADVAGIALDKAIDYACSKMIFTKRYRGNCIWELNGISKDNLWIGCLYRVTMEKYPRGNKKYGLCRIEYTHVGFDREENILGRHLARKLKDIVSK